MKLHEVTESRGQQVLRFSDYMERLAESHDREIANNARRYKKLGIALFKEGFAYEDTEFHKLPAEGGVWEFKLPSYHEDYALRMGHVKCHHINGGAEKMRRFEKTLSLNEIEAYTSNSITVLFDFMKQAARPV